MKKDELMPDWFIEWSEKFKKENTELISRFDPSLNIPKWFISWNIEFQSEIQNTLSGQEKKIEALNKKIIELENNFNKTCKKDH